MDRVVRKYKETLSDLTEAELKRIMGAKVAR
jgi:hypothetical protein